MKNSKKEPIDFNQGMKLTSLLAADLSGVTALRGTIDEQLFRRLAVRTLFSLLDAFAYQLKSRALTIGQNQGITFDRKVLLVLEEGKENVDSEGVRWIPKRPSTKDNLKVALRAFAMVNGHETPLSSVCPLPSGYDKCLGIRNRITHPKRLSEMEIGDSEVQSIAETAKWFAAISQWAKELELKALEDMRRKMNSGFDELRASISRSGR